MSGNGTAAGSDHEVVAPEPTTGQTRGNEKYVDGEWVPWYEDGDEDYHPDSATVDAEADSDSTEEIDAVESDDLTSAGSYGSSGDDTSVDTTAIKAFADQMEEYITELKASREELTSQSSVAAGAFPSGVAIADKTNSTTTSLIGAIEAMIETFTDLEEQMAKIANDYETMEEVNNIAAEKFNQLMAQVTSDISTVGLESGSSSE